MYVAIFSYSCYVIFHDFLGMNIIVIWVYKCLIIFVNTLALKVHPHQK